MIKINDILNLKIEKLSYGTSSIARLDDGFVIFIEGAVVQDYIKAQITYVNKNYAKAKILEIIEPSPYRIKPFCPLFNACGSCQFQNYDYDFLIEQKNIVLKDIFKNLLDEKNIHPILKSPIIQGYRHKIQYQARETKNSKRVLLGYFKNNSHDITNIKFCPAQHHIIDEITQFIRENYTLGCYKEKNHKGLLKHVIIRKTQELDILLIFVLNTTQNIFNKHLKEDFNTFFKKIISRYPNIKGCFINFNPEKTNKILSNTTLKIIGDDYILEKINDKTYEIGAESFFQINPYSAKMLFDIVKENIKPNSIILDAYCGVGAIGIYVSDKAQKITFIEENENAILMAKKNIEINKIQNHELFLGDTKEYFEKFSDEKRKFDYIILDPPRSGVEQQGLDNISSFTKNIIYVSCNPLTLKRDINYLSQKGFKLKSIQGVDMFPYTYHIECVAIIEKED